MCRVIRITSPSRCHYTTKVAHGISRVQIQWQADLLSQLRNVVTEEPGGVKKSANLQLPQKKLHLRFFVAKLCASVI
jgi:hypothetical protein